MRGQAWRVLLVAERESDHIIVRELLANIEHVAVELEWLRAYDAIRETLQGKRYDVCLLDYPSGGPVGIELLHELVQSTPTPFILLAESEDYQVDVAATRAGASDYLLKGHFNTPLLERAIRYAIEHRATAEALRRSEERYRAFISNSTEAIWCCELEKPLDVQMPAQEQVEWLSRHARLTEYNEAMAQLHGRGGSRELAGVALHEVVASGTADSAQYLRAFVEAGYRLSDIESQEKDESGRERYFLNNLIGIVEKGALQRVWGTQRDISARRRAEEQRDRFFTLSLDMLGIVGMDGIFKRVNPAFTETLGFSEAELKSRPFRERVHPDDRAATLEAAQGLEKGIPITDLVNRYQAKDGSWHWLEWRVVSVPEEGVIYAAARDVSERRKSEDALRRMRDELEERVEKRTAELEQANAALQIQVAERKQAEQEIRTRAGQQEVVAELGRLALSDIDLDSLLTRAAELVAKTLRVEIGSVLELLPGGEALRIRAGFGWKGDVTHHHIPARSTTQAGYALASKTPVVVSDLSEETRFEASPRLLEQGAVSGMTVVIGSYEQPYGTLGAHATRRREFTRDDIHFLQSVANVLAAAIGRYKVEEEILQLNAQLQDANEQLRVDNVQRVMAMDALREGAAELERAKAEAEQARENAEIANHAKSEFLSRMSHELRTPLNAILGFGQILAMRSHKFDAQEQDNIQQILRAGRHLLNLINEVLDISRIEAGHLSLSLEPVSAGQVVAEVLEVVSPIAAERSIWLFNEMPRIADDSYILADKQRFKQILFNLLSNAVKYNHDGGSIRLSSQIYQGETVIHDGFSCAGCLRVMVRDTGAGLSAQDINRLFVPFERLGAQNTPIEGTGIGLSLCKRLAEAMNGNVGVHSEVGSGSTFWVELPLVQNPSAAPERTMEFVPESLSRALSSTRVAGAGLPDAAATENSRTILYIEDNISNMNLIERVLDDFAYPVRVMPAMQGSIGLDLAALHQPDLILLDINLPDLAGDVVLTRLKSNPATRHIPVVILSADATPGRIDRLRAAGAIEYLTKPLNVEHFFRVVGDALKNAPPKTGL